MRRANPFKQLLNPRTVATTANGTPRSSKRVRVVLAEVVESARNASASTGSRACATGNVGAGRLSFGWARRIQAPTTTARSVIDRATPVPDGVRLVRNAKPRFYGNDFFAPMLVAGGTIAFAATVADVPTFTSIPICALAPIRRQCQWSCCLRSPPPNQLRRLSDNDVASDTDVITEICALINLCHVADSKIVASYDQFVQCYIRPDLRIITNRNPAVYHGSTTDDRIGTKIRSWRYMDGGGDIHDRQVARSESHAQSVNALPAEMNEIVVARSSVKMNAVLVTVLSSATACC